VNADVISDATTLDVHVFAPEGAGTSPVVVALHGIDGSGEDMGEVATRLAGAGEQDTTCPAWQSQQLAGALRDAGYHVELIQLTGADHFAPIFHEMRDGQFRAVADDAAGRRAVEVVLGAIATRQHASSEQ
jgi:hypothetical protein